MKLTGSRTYYTPAPPKMPPGLVELMEGLTREVLKHNPSDIYSFCASHVEQLLEKRDGPPRKKKITIEERIVRAQDKVRQNAEKRGQEYDKNLLLLQNQDNHSENGEKTLQVPEIITTEDSSIVSEKDNVILPQDQVVQNMVKVPIHHELALENSSEVEISYNISDPKTAKPVENGTKDGGINEHNTKTDDASNDKSQMITKTENDDLVQFSNETKENEDKHDTAVGNKSKTEGINDDVHNLEIKEVTDSIVSNISPEVLTVAEQPNKIDNQDVGEEGVNVHLTKEEPKPVDLTLALDSNENIPINVKDEKVVLPHEDKNIIKIVIEDHAEKPPEKENTDDDRKTDNDSDTQEINNPKEEKESISNEAPKSIPIILDQESNNTEKNPIDVEIQQSNDIKESQAENSQVSTTVENIKSPDDTKAPTKQEPDVDNDNSIQKNNEETASMSSSATDSTVLNDIETNDVNSSDVNKEQKNVEDKQMNSREKEENKEPVLENENHSQSDLPTPGIDSDIPTLITENISSESHQTSELKSDTSYMQEIESSTVASHVDKEHVVLDKVTSSNDDLDNNEANSTNTIINFSNESTHDTEAVNNGMSKNETLNNISENSHDNHDGSNMDLETAAVTIQKVFRTFLFKSRGSTFEDNANDETNYLDEDDKNKEECDFPITSPLNIERRAHGITRMDTVLQTVNEEKSLSLSDDSSTLSSAATIIQAHVRGFLVRNKLNSIKTVSTNSLAASYSNEPSITSLEADNGQNKNKTILNIHIVPGGDNYLSRDESLITSMELSLDSSPPSSINLHPLGYDKSERRKQLKREDAIQSISPPSNNSGKLSEDLDSVKEFSLNDQDVAENTVGDSNFTKADIDKENDRNIHIENDSLETVTKANKETADNIKTLMDKSEPHKDQKRTFIKMNTDEMDVVTPFITKEPESVLIHSGEFHDAVLPTRVSRSDTSVVSGE